MMIQPAKRMAVFEEAIFGQLKQRASDVQASGRPIVDLSLGSPDLSTLDIVRETLSEKSLHPEQYGYTLGGIDRFNEAVARYYDRTTGVTLDPSTEVLQTMGSQEGLVHLPLAFCDPGDVVLTTNPAYVAYEAGIRLAGAEPYEMPLRKENDFLPDFDDVPEDVARRAKLLILNLPGNPVPANPTEAFFKRAIAFAKAHDIIILHDAAYSEFYYTDERPIGFLQVAGAKDVGLETNSLSKSFSLAGARIAYFVGNAEAIRIMKQLKSNLDYGVFSPIQEAAIVALDHAEQMTDRLRDVFKERHTVLRNGLASLGWDVAPSTGGMFLWARYPSEETSVDFAFRAIDEAGVVMVPGTTFGTAGEGYVRVALVQDVDRLRQAIEQLSVL